MAHPAYSVTLADPAMVEDVLVRLWTANLLTAADPLQKLRWYYLDGPEGKGSVHLLEHRTDGQPPAFVGCAGIGVRRFVARETPLRVALLADLAVDSAHRTAFPALLLQRETRKHAKQTFDLAYGFPNANAVPVYKLLGYRELGKMTRYARVLRHERYLRRAVPIGIVARLAGLALDVAMSWRQTGIAAKLFRLEWLDEPDDRFDRLWDEAHLSYPLIAARTAAFVRWRFLGKPGVRCRLAALVPAAGAGIVAYAAVERDGDTAQIRDIFGRAAPEVGHLLDLLLPALRRQGAAAASLRFLGAHWLRELLVERGFQPRDADRSVVLDVGARLSLDPAVLADRENWYLTDGDEDN